MDREEAAEADRRRQEAEARSAASKEARLNALKLAAERYEQRKTAEAAERHQEWMALSEREKFARMRAQGHNFGDGWN